MSATLEQSLELQVEGVLRRLQIRGNLKGLKYLIYAVSETVRNPERIELITKDLYRDIARKCASTPSRVERDIRWAICLSWENAREELDQIAGRHLVKRPTNREFIDHVAFYIRSR